MADPYSKNGRWYLRYKDATGRWVDRASSAQTKAEARRLQADLERQAERQRLGLEALPTVSNDTLGDLCTWWLEECCPKSSLSRERSRLQRQVIDTELGRTPVRATTSAAVDARLREMERAGLSASYINGIRTVLRTIYSRARKKGKWTGVNPMADVERRAEPRRLHQTLRIDEVPAVIAAAPEAWRDVIATAIYSGLRKGELFGLLKSDVDLEAGTVTVARSYDHATTKGRHTDVIPIADALRPHLRHAIECSPSEYVFPAPDGAMRGEHTSVSLVLKRTLKRAGLVDGYEHTCRRCKARGTPHVERHTDAVLRNCPACGMKLWPRPIARSLRFHDLRHTTATLLLRAGVDVHRVQRILRHQDVSTTTGVYGHLVVEDLRPAVNQIAPSAAGAKVDPDPGPPSSPPPEPAPAPINEALAANLLLRSANAAAAKTKGLEDSSSSQGPSTERVTRLELATFSLGS